MKKILFPLFFLTLMVASAQAQKSSCSKPCTKSVANTSCHAKAPGVAAATSDENSDAAAKLASLDASIETRTDPANGGTYYVRKETCSHSGHVSYVNVNYDAASNTFVNVSPVKAAGSGCGTKATAAKGKSCCASGAVAGKSCCAGKSTAVKAGEKIKT